MPDINSANGLYRVYREAGLEPVPALSLAGQVEALLQDQAVSNRVRARLQHCGPSEAQDLVDASSAAMVAGTLRRLVARRPELFTADDFLAAGHVMRRLGEVAHEELTRLGL